MKGLVIILLVGLAAPCSGQQHTSEIAGSKYFTFHSNYWINLHHFLYQLASGKQRRYLEEDGKLLLPVGDDSVMLVLTQPEHDVLDKAVDYYKQHLLWYAYMGSLAIWLEEQDVDGTITDTSFSKRYTSVLNAVSPVYRSHFWPSHQAHNLNVLNAYIGTIKSMEDIVVRRLEQLAGSTWPDYKVRVDLSAYGENEGAYSRLEPSVNAFISTLDPHILQLGFLEIVFYEGTHLLFFDESDFTWTVYSISGEMEGYEKARALARRAQLYFCGRIVQEIVQQSGVPYQMMVNRRNIYAGFNTPQFRKDLERYFLGRASLEVTARRILNKF